jgi:tetratricopeptide (TPR) repeat protein
MVAASALSELRIATYDWAVAKARGDIAALVLIAERYGRDPEKRVRLAYRQYHLASLTESETDFETVRRTIAGLIDDFGPKEDVCLLKANVDGRFHLLKAVKQDLELCPSLARRAAGRRILTDVAYQEGRYSDARRGLEELIAEERTWDDLARLAHWHGKMGNVELADRLYEEAADELTAKEMISLAWLELQRGKLALSRGWYDSARKHYQLSEASFPGDWKTDVHMAGLVSAEGDLDRAVVLLQGVMPRAPRPELKQALGELLAFAGRNDEAQRWLDAALAEFLASAEKGEVHYYHHLADLFADVGGEPAKAVQWARKDLALRSNFSTQTTLAWALLQAGEVDEGLKWINKALSSGVQDAGIFATASALFRAAGKIAQGESYARAAEAINPRRCGLYLHAASF